jgi:fructose-1,6-bisphosphatase/inositol monophosphatase family enzyme
VTDERLLDELERDVLPLIRGLHARIRDAVVAAFAAQDHGALASVAGDEGGDTIYAVDRVSEHVLIEELERHARALGGIVLVAEGLAAGRLTLPRGTDAAKARLLVIVDPIDGTRGLMYQKRSAWILTGVGANRPGARLGDLALAVQTEIPLVKQHLADALWATRGRGMTAERFDVLTGEAKPLHLKPSRAASIEHGFAMLTRFFPGARDAIAEVDEEIVRAVLGRLPAGRAACFEDQYICTGGQLYELIAGHDRFNADLRPLFDRVLRTRGEPEALHCHPYDICTALIALEAGVILTAADGGTLDTPLDVDSKVSWVGYANASLRAALEPALLHALRRRNLL